MSKKSKKNERKTYIRAYDVSVKLNARVFKILDEIGHFYSHHKRKYNKVGKYTSKTRKDYLQNAVFENENGIHQSMNYRFFQGIMQDVKGQHQSIQSNRSNYLVDKQERLNIVEKEIKKLSEKYQNLIKNHSIIFNHNFNNDKKALLTILRGKYKKRQYIKNAIKKLSEKNNYSICYGSKSFMKKRQRLENVDEINEWKKEWYRKRNGQFLLVGSCDEKNGNSNAQMKYNDKKDTFSLQVRLPYVMESVYGKHVVIENIPVPLYLKKRLIEELNKHKVNAKNKNSISYRFIQLEDSTYRIIISLKDDNKPIVTHSEKGVIGVDVNADHLAVVEIARNGDILNHFNIPMDLENKTAHQRKDVIAHAIKSLRLYALEKKKHVVVENLNFKAKRQQLHQSFNKKYNRMLSAFAYKMIHDGFMKLEYEYGIKINPVSPAYTSLLGHTVAAEKGLSIHQAAAWFIAKRGYKLKEKIKEMFKYKVNDALFIVLVPSRIQQSFKLLKNFIRDIHRYIQGSLSKKKNNEFKTIVLPYSKCLMNASGQS